MDADIFLEVLPNENKIPAMFEDSYFVEAGGLMSYGSDYDEVARTAAVVRTENLHFDVVVMKSAQDSK